MGIVGIAFRRGEKRDLRTSFRKGPLKPFTFNNKNLFFSYTRIVNCYINQVLI